jgi:hypothetical protein
MIKLHFLLKTLILGIFAISIYSCSKDRLIPMEVETVTEEVNPFKDKVFEYPYNLPLLPKLASKAEKLRINSVNDLPITTKKGTKLWIYESNVRTPQNGSVTYPFDIEIIELYTLKDMLLHRKPTVSFSRMLVTGGAIYLNVSKNGTSLIANDRNPPNISVPANRPDRNMWLFYGAMDNQDNFTWAEAPIDTIRNDTIKKVQPIFAGKGTYELFPKRFGWINCDKFYDYAGEKTSVSFVSPKLGLENILIFMVFPNINSVIQVYQGQSIDIPVGEDVKIIALAQTKNGEVFAFFKDIKVEKKQTVEIDLKASTEKEVLEALDKL